MFRKRREELELIRLYSELRHHDVSSKEYQDILNSISKITEQKKSDSISKDTVAVVAGNLAGIMLILYFEKFDHISSRAINFVLKGRV